MKKHGLIYVTYRVLSHIYNFFFCCVYISFIIWYMYFCLIYHVLEGLVCCCVCVFDNVSDELFWDFNSFHSLGVKQGNWMCIHVLQEVLYQWDLPEDPFQKQTTQEEVSKGPPVTTNHKNPCNNAWCNVTDEVYPVIMPGVMLPIRFTL